ncbi:MAG TPA: ubiquinone/menaquinone biosynthesis methyltransferase [Roseiflexaceae bacterium]|nr:ubiquinone/menaquinone biosynthesis methyltransferase [Roseiflexaceae bacterium]
MSVLPLPEEKAAYVEHMFSRIASRYDDLNRAMTLGLDQSWRAQAVHAIAPPAQGRALDVGSGTGDFLELLAGWTSDGLAVGVDYTVPMMQAGLPKTDHFNGRAGFVGGDALRLPFADNTFDAITTGFMMRNVIDIAAAFREMQRVARPKGILACLEVARPENRLLALGHRLYFERIVPLVARAMGGDPTAYSYLPQSARMFPPPDALARIMRDAGWEEVRYRLVGLGAAAIHIGVKRGED